MCKYLTVPRVSCGRLMEVESIRTLRFVDMCTSTLLNSVNTLGTLNNPYAKSPSHFSLTSNIQSNMQSNINYIYFKASFQIDFTSDFPLNVMLKMYLECMQPFFP